MHDFYDFSQWGQYPIKTEGEYLQNLAEIQRLKRTSDDVDHINGVKGPCTMNDTDISPPPIFFNSGVNHVVDIFHANDEGIFLFYYL